MNSAKYEVLADYFATRGEIMEDGKMLQAAAALRKAAKLAALLEETRCVLLPALAFIECADRTHPLVESIDALLDKLEPL